ncbi:autotransporter outer membrane beta-barrel domain-containing protein [uncultured Reyranella sp.]|uniref:autotransporter outer membrane beta-barrel domain-containing protein n=1 Tax=uncultured Reyranella sp. TaxID=735512 RepID=UPI0025E70E6F|nr:autotransporter outer membrane beta-barrel domain-containing protein [uncultured Reyranella sp.]
MRRIGLLALAGAFVLGTNSARAEDFRRPGTLSRIDSTLQNALASQGLPPRDAAIVADVVIAATMITASMGAGGTTGAAGAAARTAAGAAVSPTQGFSCPVFAGGSLLLTEDGCLWGTVSGQWTSQGAGDAAGTSQAAVFRIGGQKQVAEDWFLGGFLGIGFSSGQAGGGYVSSTAQTYDGALTLKMVRGPWLLAAGLAFGTSVTGLQREAGQITGSTTSYGGSARLRGAYEFPFEGWYLRPRLDLELRYFNRPAFQESGGSGLAMGFGGESTIRPAIEPALEVGGRIDFAEGTILRPYLVAGATVIPDSSSSFQTWFVSGPLSTLGSFQASVSGPNVLATLEAGLQVYRAHGFEAKAAYGLSTGTSYLNQSATLRLAWHF